MLYLLIDIPHLVFLFLPIVLPFLPKKYLTRNLIWPMFLYALVPIIWGLFGDLCPLTVLSKKMGGLENTQSNSAFSETYLKWLYNPFLRLFGGEWNSKNIDIMANLHWLVNTLIIWYAIFYSGGNICNLKN